MTVEIQAGQEWEHAHGNNYTVLNVGKMKIGNPGESKTGWVEGVIYFDENEPDAGIFIRDKATFLERFTLVVNVDEEAED